MKWDVKALPHISPADSVAIYKAQSILTKDGKVGPLLPAKEAHEVVRQNKETYNGLAH